MKFSHSIVLAALLGSLSYSQVNAVAIKQTEAQQLMASIDLDMENLQKKHKKHHKKHHKKAHVTQVQTHDDQEGPEPTKEEKIEASAKAAKVAE